MRTAVQLKSVLALRRRRVQRLLDDHVAPEIQAELVHEIGVFNGLEDELDRLDADCRRAGRHAHPPRPAGDG